MSHSSIEKCFWCSLSKTTRMLTLTVCISFGLHLAALMALASGDGTDKKNAEKPKMEKIVFIACMKEVSIVPVPTPTPAPQKEKKEKQE